jgi:hypothetical protein
VFMSIAQSIFSFSSHDSRPPPPSASALPGQSAQNGMSMCGPGTFSPTCGGAILYAGVPRPESSGLGSSTWGATSADQDYELENLERLLFDLGINAVDVLILAPIYDAQNAYNAARHGDYAAAGLFTVMTVCDVAKACTAIVKPFKALLQTRKALARAPVRDLPDSVAQTFRGARYRSRVLRKV